MAGKIENCMDCKHHEVINDPDPDDWFCDDDVAVVCSLERNQRQDLASRYQSKRHENRAVTVSCRPYNKRAESKAPAWCPLQKCADGAA